MVHVSPLFSSLRAALTVLVSPRLRLRSMLRHGLVAASLVLGLPGLARAETPLPPAKDLQSTATKAAARHEPVVVMFSLPGCTYCERLRKSTYQWLVKDGYVVRQVEMESSYRLLGFDGKPTTGQALARHYGVKLAPTVLFLGPDGREVAERLEGAGQPDFYNAFVDRSLKQGELALGAKPSKKGDLAS